MAGEALDDFIKYIADTTSCDEGDIDSLTSKYLLVDSKRAVNPLLRITSLINFILDKYSLTPEQKKRAENTLEMIQKRLRGEEN